MWISGKSEVFPAWSSWKGRRYSAGSDMVQTNQEMERELPFFKWCFGLVFRRQDDKGPVVVLEGGVEVEMGISGKSEVFPARSSWKGRRHSAGSDMVQTNQEMERELPFFKWCFGLVFRRQDDKGPVVVLEGGVEVEMGISGKSEVFPARSSWKGRRHSAGSDMVQTNQEMERELPFFKWCFGLVFRRQDDKGPVVVLEGGVEVEMWISGKSEVFPAWSSWKGRRHSAGSDMVQTNQEMERELPFFKWCFGLVFRRQDDKGPVVVLEGGVEVEMWISGKSEVFPAWSSWKGRRHSAGSKWRRQTKKRSGNYPSSRWCFCFVCKRQADRGYVWLFCVEPGQGQFWNTRSSQQWCWARAGPVLKHQKQPAVMLSQGRASSETPEAASSDVEPGQGQFWNTRSSQQWCWARAGPVLKHQSHSLFCKGGSCVIEPITKDQLEGVLF